MVNRDLHFKHGEAHAGPMLRGLWTTLALASRGARLVSGTACAHRRPRSHIRE